MQQRLKSSIPSTNMNAEEETLDLLPEEFVPGKWDVICQRGKECYDHGKCQRAKTYAWIKQKWLISNPFFVQLVIVDFE